MSLTRAYLYSLLFTGAALLAVKGLNALAVFNSEKVGMIPMLIFVLYAYGGTLLMISIPCVDAVFILRGYLKLFHDWIGFGTFSILFAVLIAAGHLVVIMYGLYQLNLWLKFHA